ncbi:hypothetical protein [Peribacillus acanthi]|uniref:hypothetical protein n=1 Tax=Peribacillus acanthi TaxID=2171554 RepID=UPI000D3E97F3|nr:hypothetical protein [Peribacillus acanthi]
MIFLVTISILLNLVSIFAIIILYQRQNRLVQAESKQGKIIEELEDILQSFLLEMKDDNEKFMSQVQKATEMKVAPVSSNPLHPSLEISNGIVSKVSHLDEKSSISLNQNPNLVLNSYKQSTLQELDDDVMDFSEKIFTQKDKVEITIPPHSSNQKPESQFKDTFKQQLSKHNVKKDSTIQEQIDELLEKGLSLEQIAKKLNKGKTEIELLLKFKS